MKKNVIIAAIGIVIAIVGFMAGYAANEPEYEVVQIPEMIEQRFGEDAQYEIIDILPDGSVRVDVQDTDEGDVTVCFTAFTLVY